MAESAEQVYQRVVAAVGGGGRLPVPKVAEWPTFPWDVADGRLAVRAFPEPAEEQPREGEGGRPCPVCANERGEVIWQNERWRVKHLGRSGLPLVLVLETLHHLDFPELDDAQAAEYGRIAVWLTRIMERLPEVGRTHVSRWGDGCAHFHVWFLARTAGLTATRGSFAVDWDDIIPPGPEGVWRADLATVARKLATHDGRALLLPE